MNINLGRRRLILSIVAEPKTCCDPTDDYPMAVNASDAELARLNALNSALADRSRWETDAVMHGIGRLHS